MNIDIILTHEAIDLRKIRGKICVVIDTLRATSTIITAVNSGCSEIIPASSITEALRLKENILYNEYLLGGEIEGQHIQNFHLGNSPLEYYNGHLRGNGLIFSTTNGTRTLQKVRKARSVVVCALLNATAVVKWLASQSKDILICCAGTRGNYSLEDFLTAGCIVSGLTQRKIICTTTDIAYTAACFYRHNKLLAGNPLSFASLLKRTINGKRLLEAGFEEDIIYCGQQDILSVLPFYKNGTIKAFANLR
ncbi:MAG: 2-phosphosulfolactate phosphatase [Clostridiales bacterium]|jgi:2-phosphosulfolactate phosphatase|nr:2-phosphosulfolactate phosphatase [Clostridiales bacterium]